MIVKSTAGASRTSVADGRRCDDFATLFARCRRLLWSVGHHELLKRGDDMWTLQMLAYIDRGDAVTQSDLAASTGQHPAAVSRLLAELESQRLVRRRRDHADRRRVLVELTARGRDRHRVHGVPVYAAIDRRLAALSQREQEALLRLLGKLADASCAPAGAKAVATPAPRRRPHGQG